MFWKKGSMILIFIMQHKNSNLFVFYNLYFCQMTPIRRKVILGQNESDILRKIWSCLWHFEHLPMSFLWPLPIKTAPLTCVASNRMVSQLVEWSWSKSRLSKNIPKKCEGKRIQFEDTFGYCNMCGSIMIFCLKGHVGSLDYLLIKQPSSLWVWRKNRHWAPAN